MKSTLSRSSGTVARTGLFLLTFAGFVTVSGATSASEWDQWNDVGIVDNAPSGDEDEPSNAVWGNVDVIPEADSLQQDVVPGVSYDYSVPQDVWTDPIVSANHEEFPQPSVAGTLQQEGCLTNEECSNGVACDGEERCVEGMCVSGVPVVCGLPDHASSQCAFPFCYEDPFASEGYSCSYDFEWVNTPCDDGDTNACTFGICNFHGQCETVTQPMCIPPRPTSAPRATVPPRRTAEAACDTASGEHWCDPWGCVPWDVSC